MRTASTQPTVKSTDDSIFFFEMDGIPNTRSNQFSNAMSDVDESDSDGKQLCFVHQRITFWHQIKTIPDSVSEIDTSHQRYAGRPKSLNIAQSLPVSMPAITTTRDIVDADYDEVSVNCYIVRRRVIQNSNYKFCIQRAIICMHNVYRTYIVVSPYKFSFSFSSPKVSLFWEIKSFFLPFRLQCRRNFHSVIKFYCPIHCMCYARC